MSAFPFPTNLYRAIGEGQVTVVAHDDDGAPTVVCVFAESAFERAAALVLLEHNPASFVVSHGLRYSPGGSVQPYDPSQPWYAGELPMCFDVEWVTPGPQPRVYVFTHTEQEWVNARQAMKHLLQLGRLFPWSYLEGNHTNQDQGLSAQNLDGKPHNPGLVAMYREAAYCIQNDLCERNDEAEDWRDEEVEEMDEDWREEEACTEAPVSLHHRISALIAQMSRHRKA